MEMAYCTLYYLVGFTAIQHRRLTWLRIFSTLAAGGMLLQLVLIGVNKSPAAACNALQPH